ncbi:glycerophosphodiester phosphodiesterase family protein [Henriciella mobilis]|uniref:glycerophosphodiester phosphodiesterase family protein n=1 Tax=Henriciella mobilis TaxID=2305467 RepID=UPI001F1D2FDB|nr:glycerophosphodiester phosphodiesterase family protein [Henriciella mobilis]
MIAKRCPGAFAGLALITFGLLAACDGSKAKPAENPRTALAGQMQEAGETVRAPFDLPAVFDCVREEGGLLIAAHRGGPAKGFPENTLETLQNGFDHGIRVFEVDVAQTRDGTLILMHDRTLGRTTTGSGPVSDSDWDEIGKLDTVDNDGLVTPYAVPTLHEALLWAMRTGAILELDRKETTSFRNIVQAVQGAGAESNVVLITYNDDEALHVSDIAPEMMMTAGIGGRAHEADMLARGLDADRLIAWTGTERPSPGKWRGLASKGIESAFGTLGRADERLDDQYWADGDPSEYEAFIEDGLVLLATDTPYRLLKAGGSIRQAADTARTRCLGEPGQ